MHPLLHRPLNHSVLWYKSESFWWFLSVTNIKSLLTLDPLDRENQRFCKGKIFLQIDSSQKSASVNPLFGDCWSLSMFENLADLRDFFHRKIEWKPRHHFLIILYSNEGEFPQSSCSEYKPNTLWQKIRIDHQKIQDEVTCQLIKFSVEKNSDKNLHFDDIFGSSQHEMVVDPSSSFRDVFHLWDSLGGLRRNLSAESLLFILD